MNWTLAFWMPSRASALINCGKSTESGWHYVNAWRRRSVANGMCQHTTMHAHTQSSCEQLNNLISISDIHWAMIMLTHSPFFSLSLPVWWHTHSHMLSVNVGGLCYDAICSSILWLSLLCMSISISIKYVYQYMYNDTWTLSLPENKWRWHKRCIGIGTNKKQINECLWETYPISQRIFYQTNLLRSTQITAYSYDLQPICE